MKDIINQYEPYGLILWVVFWGLAILNLCWSYMSVISIAIFFFLKPRFEEHAKKINGDPRIPFISVLFFGFVGYIGYLIYCQMQLNKGGNNK